MSDYVENVHSSFVTVKPKYSHFKCSPQLIICCCQFVFLFKTMAESGSREKTLGTPVAKMDIAPKFE